MKFKSARFYRLEEPIDEHDKDLLRYDLGFVSLRDPLLVAFPAFRTDTGLLGGSPTVGRWRSYGRRLTEILDRTAELSETLAVEKTEWHTYRHPFDGEGRRIYEKLSRVSFAQFVDPKVKNTDNL